MARPRRLVLVTGGARSGKSTFAEGWVHERAGDAVTYIATAEALDGEMSDRIAKHRAQRPDTWQTVEAPRDVATALAAAEHEVVLLDCLTLLVSNHLLDGGEEAAEASVKALIAAWREADKDLVVVTNEVGWSIVPMNKLARQFRDLQGRLNRVVMDAATDGWLVVAGCPLKLKGDG